MSFWHHTSRASRFTEPMTRRGRRAGGAGTVITIDGATGQFTAKAIRCHDGAVVTLEGRGTVAQAHTIAAEFAACASIWCADDGNASEWIGDGEWTEANAGAGR